MPSPTQPWWSRPLTPDEHARIQRQLFLIPVYIWLVYAWWATLTHLPLAQASTDPMTGTVRDFVHGWFDGIEAIKISDYLRFGTGLDNRLTELAIILAARNWDNDYIWTPHYAAAVKAGVDPSVGADIAAGKRPTKMKEDETIVYDLLSEIYRDRKVSDATFAKAVGKYGEKGIMDIIGLASYYGNTAMAVIVSNGTRPAAPGEPKLQKLTQNFPK